MPEKKKRKEKLTEKEIESHMQDDIKTGNIKWKSGEIPTTEIQKVDAGIQGSIETESNVIKVNITAQNTEEEVIKKIDDAMKLAEWFKRKDTLALWLFKKYRRYWSRENPTEFFHSLAMRIMQILKDEPDHEIVKVLRGKQ